MEENNNGPCCFTFGEPEQVHSERILDYLGVFPEAGGEYYLPPVSLSGLAKMRRANGHHGSCILFRRNMAAVAYVSGGLSIRDFRASVTDFLSFGHAYLLKTYNAFGKWVGIRHIAALNMRVLADGAGYRLLLRGGDYIDYPVNNIIEIAEYDEIQQIYGMPDWLGGMQSALLNEDATLFRRRYFVNGAHLGYILYTNDPKMSPELRVQLAEKFRQGKGPGNFKSNYIDIPGGAEKAIQIISIGDISQKDEFNNIKSITAGDVQIAHRVPPGLLGVIPTGQSAFGDIEKAERVYLRTETRALCQNYLDLNDQLPSKLRLKFNFEINTKEVNP